MSFSQNIEKLKGLRLSAMAQSYEDQRAHCDLYRDLSFDDRLSMMIDHEVDVRATKKIERLVKDSGMFFKKACPEDISYAQSRGISREALAPILDCSYIEKGQNVLLEGASATGKTFVACAFGVAACRKGHKVKYYKMRSLIDELLVSRAALDGSYQKLIDKLRKTPLLIIDDFLLHEIASEELGELLELVDARLLSGSTIICSQYQHDGWIKIIGRTPISEAFMSRMQASSHVIRLRTAEDLRVKGLDLLC